MSYANDPDVNPYAAPQSAVASAAYAPSATFYGWAGFWRRFAAAFLDGIITGIAGGVIGGVIGGIAGATGNVGPNGQLPIGLQVGLQVIGVVIGVLYFAGMESSQSQATLGKMALGIKVTDLHGRRISFGRAIGRYFAKIISYLTFLIGFIMAGFTEKKQALHDMIAGTLVIKTR